MPHARNRTRVLSNHSATDSLLTSYIWWFYAGVVKASIWESKVLNLVLSETFDCHKGPFLYTSKVVKASILKSKVLNLVLSETFDCYKGPFFYTSNSIIIYQNIWETKIEIHDQQAKHTAIHVYFSTVTELSFLFTSDEISFERKIKNTQLIKAL